MAVTQLLARVHAADLAHCRATAAGRPDADPGWAPPAGDVLDLDWAPHPLEDACRRAGLDGRLLAALRRATTGDPEVDVAFLDHPDAVGIFGPPPAALAPEGVAAVAHALAAIDRPAVLPPRPGVRGLDGVRDPQAYLTGHFRALCAFCAEAARRGQYVVMWWD
ncbi:DUF1877 domain-containing protein [Streptomyces sp. MI02-7b]|uniref:DUF1877 domain-containing protein n=1 Tax=Streptomyces sp. MI02-7b TaxID=462941 RepID=UPI0029A1A634|nr:DUF1877 domain-containing protein [Streptomyces sp. MI02-7b]MDX3073166.1 DUF1877 domain-containing protein [Streptomyces sp. MI02-7b]